MDVLSEVLKAVKLDGAMFYNAEYSAPWCFRAPASRTVAPYPSPGSGHVIMYHLLTEGRGYARVEGDGRPVPINAGDIVIFPHGDSHIMGNGSPIKPVDNEQELQRILSQGLKVSRLGGGGEITKFICGYMACEPQLSRVFLGGLPPILKVNIRNDASASGWKTPSAIRWVMRMLPGPVVRPCSPGCPKYCSSKLCDATSRCCRGNKPGGWPASATRKSGKPWPCCIASRPIPGRLPALANEVGISRSVLAERFRRYLSETPIAYLTRWRLQLGAQMLKSTSSSVAQVAAEVGYGRSRPLTAPSNVSSASRRPDSAANRNQPAPEPSATHRRTLAAARSDERCGATYGGQVPPQDDSQRALVVSDKPDSHKLIRYPPVTISLPDGKSALQFPQRQLEGRDEASQAADRSKRCTGNSAGWLLPCFRRACNGYGSSAAWHRDPGFRNHVIGSAT